MYEGFPQISTYNIFKQWFSYLDITEDGYFTELWMFSGLRRNIYFTAKLEELDQNFQR